MHFSSLPDNGYYPFIMERFYPVNDIDFCLLPLFFTLFKRVLVLTCLHYKSFENTAGKGEIARNEQFLLFPQCFQRIWRTYGRVHQICYCRLQTLSVWMSLKFVVCERVNTDCSRFTDWWCLTFFFSTLFVILRWHGQLSMFSMGFFYHDMLCKALAAVGRKLFMW